MDSNFSFVLNETRVSDVLDAFTTYHKLPPGSWQCVEESFRDGNAIEVFCNEEDFIQGESKYRLEDLFFGLDGDVRVAYLTPQREPLHTPKRPITFWTDDEEVEVEEDVELPTTHLASPPLQVRPGRRNAPLGVSRKCKKCLFVWPAATTLGRFESYQSRCVTGKTACVRIKPRK